MTRLITKAALLTACGMLVAAAAMAGVPNAGTSTSASFIRLVGHSATTVPDTIRGGFVITVNDVAHNPIAGSNVVVDFSGCSADIRIASNQLNVNYTTACATHSVSAYTNSAGVVKFTLLGNSLTSGTHTVAGCARIYADGVLLSSPTVATADMDGSNGASPADMSLILADILAAGHPYRARADIDGSLVNSPADLSVELALVLAAKSNQSAGVVCP